MKKLSSIFFTVMLFASISFSQSNITLGVGVTGLQPVGDFSTYFSTGFGGLVQGEMAFAGWKGIASIGYTYNKAKDLSSGLDGSLSNIPVLVGAEYTFAPNFYGKAQVGINFLTAKYSGTIYGYSFDYSTSSTKFGFLVGVGYTIKMIDVSIQYQMLGSEDNSDGTSSTYGGIALNVLYKFAL